MQILALKKMENGFPISVLFVIVVVVMVVVVVGFVILCLFCFVLFLGNIFFRNVNRSITAVCFVNTILVSSLPHYTY